MYTFCNATTRDGYDRARGTIEFEGVPNTAAGYENCRKYIIHNGYKYFVSAINDVDFFLACDDIQCPSDRKFAVWFRACGDNITICRATNNGRSEKAGKYLKKYARVVCMAHSCIKYGGIVAYRR